MAAKKNRWIWIVLEVIAAAILVVCAVVIVRQVGQMRLQQQDNERVSLLARPTQSEDDPAAAPTPAATQMTTGTPTPAPVPQEIDFVALWEENDEIFAWITLDGTVIDYPMLCRPEDDTYYHTHNVAGREVTAGSIYIQGQWNSTDMTDFHTVVYGHNMRDGSMFAALHKFESREFFDEHDAVVIYMPSRRLTYTIFAAYKRDDALLTKKFDYSTETGRQAFLDDIYSHSGFFREGIAVTTDSRVLTLSTCVGGEDDKRFVVQAVLTEDVPVE